MRKKTNKYKKIRTAFRFANPEKIIEELKIKEGDVVADFGSGSGFFTLPLARKVGVKGVVYAIDVLPSALEAVAGQAHTFGLENIVIKRADLSVKRGSGLPDESLDCVILKDILFQNEEKKQILKEAYRVLKKGGKLLVMEWNETNFAMGPDLKKRVSIGDLMDIISAEGFSVSEPEEAGNFHYFLIGVK